MKDIKLGHINHLFFTQRNDITISKNAIAGTWWTICAAGVLTSAPPGVVQRKNIRLKEKQEGLSVE